MSWCTVYNECDNVGSERFKTLTKRYVCVLQEETMSDTIKTVFLDQANGVKPQKPDISIINSIGNSPNRSTERLTLNI